MSKKRKTSPALQANATGKPSAGNASSTGRKMSPERRRIEIFAALLAGVAASVNALPIHQRWIHFCWLGLLCVGVLYVVVTLVKLNRSGR